MLTPADIAEIRALIVHVLRGEARAAGADPASLTSATLAPSPSHLSTANPSPSTAPARAWVHPTEAAVAAFLEALPVDGAWITSRELHAAFLASQHATGLAAHASVVVVGVMASRARGRLVETARDGVRGTRYRRIG